MEKLQEKLWAYFSSLSTEGIMVLVVWTVIAIWIGYILSRKLKPEITKDIKIQCTTYSALCEKEGKFMQERYLYATAYNNKTMSIGCPYFSQGGKCNNKNKCIKM